MITKAALKQRLEQLQREREQLVANVHAYEGAIQECEYWLRQLVDKEENSQP